MKLGNCRIAKSGHEVICQMKQSFEKPRQRRKWQRATSNRRDYLDKPNTERNCVTSNCTQVDVYMKMA